MSFAYFEEQGSWLSKVDIEGAEVEVEIDMALYSQDDVDWEHSERFLAYLSTDGRLVDWIERGSRLAEGVGLAHFREHIDGVAEWKMMFSDLIIFRGPPKGGGHQESFEFSLAYHFTEEEPRNNVSINGDFDGLYLTDVHSIEGVQGARRI